MIAVIENFLTPHELDVLLKYGSEAPMHKRNQNHDMVGGSGLRETVRFNWSEQNYPEEVVDVYDRICGQFDLYDRMHTDGEFGQAVRYHVGGRTLEHIDKKTVLGGRTFRSNIVVQNAEEGGEFTYMGEVIPTPVGALFVFDASELHAVLTTKKGMRIVFRWGWRDL